MKEIIQSSRLVALVKRVSQHIDEEGFQEFYRTLPNPNSEISINMGIPLLFGKNKLSNIFLYALILITALSVALPGVSSLTTSSPEQTPEPTPSVPTLVGVQTIIGTITEGKVQTTLTEQEWDCKNISDAIPNAFRAALYAGNSQLVEPPPFLFDPQGNDPPREVSTLPRLVHKGDKICVKR